MKAGPGAPLGNNNRGKNRPWSDAIRRALLANNGKAMREIADALIEKAKDGDVRAAELLGDRFEGKVPQALEHSGTAIVQIIFSAQDERL